MTQVAEFKPVLLYTDEKVINQILKDTEKVTDTLNKCLRQAEKFLERPLSDDEFREISINGMAFIDAELEEKFSFPNATKEFNLDAMGKKAAYQETQNVLMHISRGSDHDIKDGTAVLSEKAKQRIIDTHKYFTKNETQNEILKIAKRMVKDLNALCELGSIGRYEVNPICEKLGFLEPTYTSDGKNLRFKIKGNHIKSIEETGRYNAMI